MRRIAMMLGVLTATAALAGEIRVPLTVVERAGVARVGNHVNSGVPLPVAAVKDVGELALFTADGKPVDAQIVPRCRWLKDKSLKFVTVHFACDVAARGTARYVLKTAKAVPSKRIRVQAADDAVTVDTGPLKFVVRKGDFHVLHQVWLNGAEVVPAGAASLKLLATEGAYKVAGEKAVLDKEGEPFTPRPVARTLEVEESGPVRAVIKATGGFVHDGRTVVDFVCRVYALAGSPSVRVMLTVINRSGKKFSDFVGLNELAVTVPLKGAAGNLTYAFGAVKDPDITGTLAAGKKATLLQLESTRYTVDGKPHPGGRDQLSRRLGWVDLAGGKAGLALGVRYFWQLYPKGLEATGDGAVTAWLVAPGGKPPMANRPPLFCGGARSHEILFAFHPPGESGRARAMGVVDPLFAAAPTAWYCQKTFGFARTYDDNLDNFKPEHRELIKQWQANLDARLRTVLGRRDGKRQGVEEYGFFNFGCQPHHSSLVAKNDWLNSAWNSNYYDYPFAVLLNFARTGSLACLDVAREHGLHLADVDVCHWYPGRPHLNGIERMGYTFGHFRQWWSGRKFGVSGNADSTKNQSLYHLYYLTGDRWFLDAALLVSNYNAVHGGGALRAVANRMTGLFGSYEATHDPKHFARWKNFVTKTAIVGRAKRRGLGRWDQEWMYGMAAEALMKYYRVTGDGAGAGAVVTCCDSLIKNYWREGQGTKTLHGFTVNCFGYAYELTGDAEYLNKGLVQFKAAAKGYAGRTKSFAQQFRLSPHLLYYLAKDYVPPEPIVKATE